MRLQDFHFDLPPELIARYPLSRRSESRLMCLHAQAEPIHHRQFDQLFDLIHPGDLLVFNDTKVIPARLLGRKTTGGVVEVLVERIISDHSMLALVRVSKPPRVGDRLIFTDEIYFEITDRRNQFYELSYRQTDRTILDIIEEIGEIPLPPYMQRDAEKKDKERYQTVYAKHKGAIAAPTAGLHFDEELLAQLRAKNVEFGYLTLHVGLGTFAPVRVQDIREHQMHTERLEISVELAEKIKSVKAAGKRIIAVGTTSLRALETASQSGAIEAYHGETNIFIYPGYQFHCVDALITNFHLPSSTLLMLVCAFGGHKKIMHAYRMAAEQTYRFYSYGDAMWIER